MKNQGGHLNVLYLVFTSFLLMQVIFSKIELEISPFLTVIQFYSNIVEKRVGKSPQGISTRATFRNVLTSLKGTRQNQNRIAPRYGKYIGLYLPDYRPFAATTDGYFST